MKIFLSLFFLLATFVVSFITGSGCADETPVPLQMQRNADDSDGSYLNKLLQQTSQGLLDYGIVQLDPLWIPTVDVAYDSDGVFYQNREITVTGLNNLKVSDFRIDPANKMIILKSSVDLGIDGNVTGVFTRSWQSIAGRYWSNGNVLSTAICSYELATDDSGVQHIILGPETVTCDILSSPRVRFNPELELALCSDSVANTMHSNPTKRDAMRDTNFCKIAEKAYASVVQNIRAAAEILPASAFFKNLL